MHACPGVICPYEEEQQAIRGPVSFFQRSCRQFLPVFYLKYKCARDRDEETLAQKASAQKASAQEDSAQEDSAQEDSAQEDPAQEDSAQGA